ncbi:MAG: bZIP transcription factor [Phycisphaerae bacterium]|nr:bZIP transcription factor [Saprospiraceae bacterium]
MNKKLFSLAIFAFFLGLCAEKINAQASGTNPQLYMYRHNGSPGNSPSPAVSGNTLGNLEWRALTAINSTKLGATIKSVAANVSPNFLMSNMIFSTSGAAGLKERMVITENGLVGIGLPNPQWHLDVVGNTHTSGNFWGRIHFDNNATDEMPSTYFDEAYFERKVRAQIGLGANFYANGGTLTLAPGGGSLDRQLFTGGNDGLWTRSQNLGGTDNWAAWEKILTSGDILGRSNMLARYMPPGTTSSTLRDGQVFDNGTNVVIGGMPAFPTPPAPVFDAADALTVTGRARVDGNTYINGNMGVGVAPTANRLEVSGDSRFAGNVNVTGNGRVDGMLVIGNPPSVPVVPVQHELYVNGSIIAEEVVVKLQGNWPDYVMAEGYDLKPLSEVEAFIQQEKHLPGVPSASEVAENGISLGEMQKTQMEKIEELYLHMIEMEKQVKTLKAENEALKTKVDQMEKR